MRNWIDFGAAGVEDLRLKGASSSAAGGGHGGRRIPFRPAWADRSGSEPAVAGRVLEARAAIHRRLQEPDLAQLVEQFDPARYNRNMTVAENLLFGTPRGAVFDFSELRDNKVLAEVIESEGLKPALMAMGEKIAETMVELFADLPPGHPSSSSSASSRPRPAVVQQC